jgi:hypothetical protein
MTKSIDEVRAANVIASRKYRANNYAKCKARWDKHNKDPDVKARKRALESTPEQKQKKHEYYRNRWLNEPGFRERRLDYQLLKKAGMTRQMYESVLHHQQNRCPICRREFCDSLRAHADHCHESGKPRGILCEQCNRAEGMIRAAGVNALEFGQRLHEYLTRPFLS